MQNNLQIVLISFECWAKKNVERYRIIRIDDHSIRHLFHSNAKLSLNTGKRQRNMETAYFHYRIQNGIYFL